MYQRGAGVPQDYAEALKWYRKAAEQGNDAAENNLGALYEYGNGVEKDLGEAIKWFQKAAGQGSAEAEFNIGTLYETGAGVTKDDAQAIKWYRKAAEQGHAKAQFNLGAAYHNGNGATQDDAEAMKWYRKASEQGLADAQYNLGFLYHFGEGTPKNYAEASKWYRKAAGQGVPLAQLNLGVCYYKGEGVPKDYVEAYKWFNLAAAQGEADADKYRDILARVMTPDQISKAQQLSKEFISSKNTPGSIPNDSASVDNPTATGTGFFITDDGYLISNYHVVKNAAKVRLLTGAGLIDAKVVQVDAANDLALLRADGRFACLPIAASRTMALGGTVATVGFPDIGLQGFAPKLAKGEIASLSGAADDPRYFQISVPVQPGNSGGALVDERGNVIGIVSAKLNASAALAASGALPENVNYAVKSSFLLSFLESVPAVSAKLKAPVTADRKFEDVVKSAQDAAVLVLVY